MPSWRPGSTRPGATKNAMPTSWNSPLEKRGPLWQKLQFASPTKSASPRRAAARIACRRGLVAARERIAKRVELRAARSPAFPGTRPAPWPRPRRALRRRRAAACRTPRRSACASRRCRARWRRDARGCCPFRAGRAAAAGSAPTGCRWRRPSRTSAGRPRCTGSSCCGRSAPDPWPAAARRRTRAPADGSRRRRACPVPRQAPVAEQCGAERDRGRVAGHAIRRIASATAAARVRARECAAPSLRRT